MVVQYHVVSVVSTREFCSKYTRSTLIKMRRHVPANPDEMRTNQSLRQAKLPSSWVAAGAAKTLDYEEQRHRPSSLLCL